MISHDLGRVAHLGQVGVRKLLRTALSRGWAAWHGVWLESTRQRNLLKKAGARLTRPLLLQT